MSVPLMTVAQSEAIEEAIKIAVAWGRNVIDLPDGLQVLASPILGGIYWSLTKSNGERIAHGKRPMPKESGQ